MNSILKNKQLKEVFLFYYSLFLVVLLLATVNLDKPFLLWLLTGASTLLLLNPVYLLPVYIVSSLSSDYFIASDGLGISRLIGFILIAGSIIHLLRNNYPFAQKKVIILLLVILFYTYISSLLSLVGLFKSAISFTQNVIIIILLSQFRNVYLETLSKLLALSAVITILTLAFTLRDNLIHIHAQRLSTGEEVNENMFAMMLAQLTAIAFASFLIFNKRRIVQILILGIILLSFFMLILSGSRSATIGITGAIIVVLLHQFKKHASKLIFSSILIIVAGFLFINHIQHLNIPFIDRFTIGNVRESGGTHRLESWEKLVPITLNQRPFFGFGFGGENGYALAKQNGFRHPPHNFVIDIFIQTGLIGLMLFFSYFYLIAKKLKKSFRSPYTILPAMLLLTALLNGIGETIYLEKFFWNGIALGWLYLNNTSNSVQELNA